MEGGREEIVEGRTMGRMGRMSGETPNSELIGVLITRTKHVRSKQAESLGRSGR